MYSKFLAVSVTSALSLVAVSAQAHNGFHLVSAKARTLTESGLKAEERKTNSLRLVIRTGPHNDMLSYRIKGQKNPTLTIKHGATVRVLFVNSDDDMKHDVRFTTRQAPFDSTVSNDGTVGSDALLPMAGGKYHAQEIVLKAPEHAGKFTYVCTVPGHAAAGMYGTIIVK